MAVPGTVMPAPKYTAYDSNGLPLAGGLLEIYAAGTSTPVQGYADSSLLTPLPNPVVLDGGGRASIFLAPGFYKFIQRTSVEKGAVVVWTQDNVSSTHPFAEDFDIEATAGESLVSGQSVYLSQGLGGLIPGRWYLTDSDVLYASTGAEVIGIWQTTTAPGVFGTVRIQGRSAVPGPLTIGASYYVGPTPGTLVTPAPANARLVGIADSATTIVTATGFGAKVFIGAVTIDGPLSVTGKITANSAQINTTLTVTGLTRLNGGVDTTDLTAINIGATTGHFGSLGDTPLNAAYLYGYVNPGAHKGTHELGGSDQLTGAISVSSISAPNATFGSLSTTPIDAANLFGTVADARLTVNVLKVTGGYPGGTDAYLRADGLFAIPPGGGSGGGAPAVHHASHEPGGSDQILNAAWTTLANTFTQAQTFGGDLLFSGGARTLRQTTADAADNGSIALIGGGAQSVTRGAWIQANGNESAGTGILQLVAGDVVGGNITFFTGGTTARGVMHRSGGFSWGSSTDPGANNLSVAGGLRVNGGEILFGIATSIRANTSDGADNQAIYIAGGGSVTAERGAYVGVNGNEAPAVPGALYLVAGNHSTGGKIVFCTGPETVRGIIHPSGGLSWGSANDPGAGNMVCNGTLAMGGTVFIYGTPAFNSTVAVGLTTYGVFANSNTNLYVGIESAAANNITGWANSGFLYASGTSGLHLMSGSAIRFQTGGATVRGQMFASGGFGWGAGANDPGNGHVNIAGNITMSGSYPTMQLSAPAGTYTQLIFLVSGSMLWNMHTAANPVLTWNNAQSGSVMQLAQNGTLTVTGHYYAGGSIFASAGLINAGPAMAPAPATGRFQAKFGVSDAHNYGFQAALIYDGTGSQFLSCWNYGNVSGSTNIGSVTQLGTGLGVAFNTSSDMRLKKDRGVAMETDVLRQLVIHDFDWLSEAIVGKDIPGRGIFAQEAYEIAPFAIMPGTDERNEEGSLIQPWGIDHSKFVPDLIVGWQQHDRIIEALLKRIIALEAKQ